MVLLSHCQIVGTPTMRYLLSISSISKPILVEEQVVIGAFLSATVTLPIQRRSSLIIAKSIESSSSFYHPIHATYYNRSTSSSSSHTSITMLKQSIEPPALAVTTSILWRFLLQLDQLENRRSNTPPSALPFEKQALSHIGLRLCLIICENTNTRLLHLLLTVRLLNGLLL